MQWVILETIPVSTRQTKFFKRQTAPRTGKPPSAFFKERRSFRCYSFGQRKLVEPSTGILMAIQVPFVPLPTEWVTCVSLCLDLSNKLLAEAKGKAGVDIHGWPLRTPIISIPTWLIVLKGRPTRLLETTLRGLIGSCTSEACIHIALGRP